MLWGLTAWPKGKLRHSSPHLVTHHPTVKQEPRKHGSQLHTEDWWVLGEGVVRKGKGGKGDWVARQEKKAPGLRRV